MLYCQAYPVKKLIPLDRIASAEPCLGHEFEACPLFKDVLSRMRAHIPASGVAPSAGSNRGRCSDDRHPHARPARVAADCWFIHRGCPSAQLNRTCPVTRVAHESEPANVSQDRGRRGHPAGPRRLAPKARARRPASTPNAAGCWSIPPSASAAARAKPPAPRPTRFRVPPRPATTPSSRPRGRWTRARSPSSTPRQLRPALQPASSSGSACTASNPRVPPRAPCGPSTRPRPARSSITRTAASAAGTAWWCARSASRSTSTNRPLPFVQKCTFCADRQAKGRGTRLHQCLPERGTHLRQSQRADRTGPGTSVRPGQHVRPSHLRRARSGRHELDVHHRHSVRASRPARRPGYVRLLLSVTGVAGSGAVRAHALAAPVDGNLQLQQTAVGAGIRSAWRRGTS